MPGQGMCNRILHSQKKQGRAFGVAPQVLDAAGQTFAEAFHIKGRVDVVTDVPQTRPKFHNSLRPGLPLLRHQVEPGGTRSEPGETRQEPL